MALPLALFAATVSAPAVPELRVAAVFNLTGSMRSVDLPGYQGMKLAAEELNQRKKIKVTLRVIDGQSKPATMASRLNAVLSKEKIDVISGVNDSDYALAVGRVAQARRIPFVANGATLPGITRKIGPYAFTACFDDHAQARAMALFAREVLKVQTAAVLVDPSSSYTSSIAKAFPGAFGEKGGRWLLTINDPNPGRKDPIKFGSDAVYAATLPEASGKTVKRLRTHGFEGTILSGSGWDTSLLAKDAGVSAFKVFFTTHVSYDDPAAKVQAFAKAYRARFKEHAESASAALAYDSLRLLADARLRKGQLSLREAIAATSKFPGVTGTISYSAGSREPEKPVSVVEQLGRDRVYRGTFDSE